MCACSKWSNAHFILYEDLVGTIGGGGWGGASRKIWWEHSSWGQGGGVEGSTEKEGDSEAMQNIFISSNRRVWQWGSWKKTWSHKVLRDLQWKIPGKRIRNEPQRLERKGKPSKHDVVKVWLRSGGSDIPSLRTWEVTKLHSLLNEHASWIKGLRMKLQHRTRTDPASWRNKEY